ncbi:DUF3433 domain protein [Phlyctema vagabunda]|uniref:DUF3433 domain protein n=1 Tax=Phlyctema vagabunda TaxID=108571 RepID=A0ABR4PR04_9HELO
MRDNLKRKSPRKFETSPQTMASHDGIGDGYPWGHNGQNNQTVHRMATVSDVSSSGSSRLGQSSHPSSSVSLATQSEVSTSHSSETIDVSHVQISSGRSSTIISSIDGSSEQKHSSTPLPDPLRVGTPISPGIRGFIPFSAPSGGVYQPLSPAETPLRRSSTSQSRRASTKKKLSIFPDRSIPEEIDIGLLGAAAPITSHKTSYAPDSDDEDVQVSSPIGAGVDISSFEGPHALHKKEAQGILTGGLGVGFKPDATIKSKDLIATGPPPTSPTQNVTRRLSRRISRTYNPGRTLSIREMGQNEADKRGEIIEVILEDAPVDISSFAGGNASSTADLSFEDDSAKRQSTFVTQSTFRTTNVEVFYPQANWRPFSMRWPYLTALIISSVVLAAAQEYLYQNSIDKPLYTFKRPSELRTWDYFSFKYLPTLIAVAFGVLWQITDFEVKRLEAYYQLSKQEGALAAESINVDYITFFNFLRPVRALQFKHYAVAVSSVATLLAVSLVPTLQSASVVLSPDRKSREAHPTDLKEIQISGPFSRMLSVVLVIVALLGCVLLWQLERRRSGLVADVKGIAGIAAMANRSHILMDFKDMDTANPEMIHQKLKDHRYILRNSSLAPDDRTQLTRQEKDKYDQHERPGNPHPLMLRLPTGILLISGMVLFIGLIPVILFTDANIITDKAPWFVTGLAVCIKLAWGTLETDVRMMEPFYILTKRYASPKVLTLDYSSMPFGWMPVAALFNGHFLVASVGLGSVLAEILTVCAISFSGVAGLDFTNRPPPKPLEGGGDGPSNAHDASEETLLSFWFSFALACCITLYLCGVAAVVYARRRHAFLPRQPNTIASVLAYIHQSKMLYDFVGTEKKSNDDMVKHLVAVGKTYGLGWFTGRDGETHCGVDEEELVSAYRYGADARDASMPWSVDWEHY